LQATTDARQTLEDLGVLQRSIRFTVMSTPPGASAAEGLEPVEPFHRSCPPWSSAWPSRANAQVDTEVARTGRAKPRRARKRLLWQAAPLLPLAVVAVFVFTLGVGRTAAAT